MKALLRKDVKDHDSSKQCPLIHLNDHSLQKIPSIPLNFRVLNLNTNSLLTEIRTTLEFIANLHCLTQI